MKHISHVTKEMPAQAQLLGWLGYPGGIKGMNELGDLVVIVVGWLEGIVGPILPSGTTKSGN